jgi:hypothetical protein
MLLATRQKAGRLRFAPDNQKTEIGIEGYDNDLNRILFRRTIPRDAQ